MTLGDQSARLVRERDGRLTRVMGATLLISACLVGMVLGIVGIKVNQVRLSYRLDQLRLVRSELREVNRQLRVELATLRTPARIESKARAELGMLAPSRNQVRLAREYVPGRAPDAAGVGRGTASLRTAWEEPLAPHRPPVR